MPKSLLYSLTTVDKKTGERVLIYGHVTGNVIEDYWRAYVSGTHRVEIEDVTEAAEAEYRDRVTKALAQEEEFRDAYNANY